MINDILIGNCKFIHIKIKNESTKFKLVILSFVDFYCEIDILNVTELNERGKQIKLYLIFLLKKRINEISLGGYLDRSILAFIIYNYFY